MRVASASFAKGRECNGQSVPGIEFLQQRDCRTGFQGKTIKTYKTSGTGQPFLAESFPACLAAKKPQEVRSCSWV